MRAMRCGAEGRRTHKVRGRERPGKYVNGISADGTLRDGAEPLERGGGASAACGANSLERLRWIATGSGCAAI
jgi:hypothetical protein